eukprot:5859605-Pleurochrysis_carterae.AAC.1
MATPHFAISYKNKPSRRNKLGVIDAVLSPPPTCKQVYPVEFASRKGSMCTSHLREAASGLQMLTVAASGLVTWTPIPWWKLGGCGAARPGPPLARRAHPDQAARRSRLARTSPCESHADRHAAAHRAAAR